MNFAAERAAIEKRFSTAWSTRTPVAFENVNFIAPGDFGAFVRLVIRNGDSRSAGVQGDGTILNENQGRIWTQVFVKEGTGTTVARGHADAAAAIFNNARFDGIRCYASEVRAIGSDGKGYFQFNVSTPYRRFSN